MSANQLWRFRWPSRGPSPADSLYVRTAGGGGVTRTDPSGAVVVDASGPVTFDTYFNAFAVGKWVRHTTVSHLSLAVTTCGGVRLEVIHEEAAGRPCVVATGEFHSDEPTVHELPIPDIDERRDGMLFLRVSSTGTNALISAAQWQTTDAPRADVRLGVVITTYHRREDVRTNVTRLLKSMDATDLEHALDLVVVDNGCTLDQGDVDDPRVVVLPNRNTGGSGGFACGLMHLREAGRVTHVLFMDDDVRFDPEIVLRTLRVLSYARDRNLCLAGAMLERERPTHLFEAGARFAGRSAAPNSAIGGLGVDTWPNVLLTAEERETIDYGAWWFFAFPIDLTPDYPLPMFIRGDDVAWGLMHAFGHILTVPGIGLWHDGFERKNGPLSAFYETRNLALIGTLAVPRFQTRHLLYRYVNLCVRSLFSLKYATAEHITFALREFLAGPDHWLALDHAALNDRLARFDGERVELLSEAMSSVEEMPVACGIPRLVNAARSVLLLGGHLVPARFAQRPLLAVKIGVRVLGAAPGHDAILYRDTSREYGFVAHRDRKRFFRDFGAMAVTATRIATTFPRVQRAYRAAYPEMVSAGYWRSQFGAGSPSTGPAAATGSAVPDER